MKQTEADSESLLHDCATVGRGDGEERGRRCGRQGRANLVTRELVNERMLEHIVLRVLPVGHIVV